jgi:hypothetical protein
MVQINNSDKNHEIEMVLKLCSNDLREALKIYDQQLNVLQSRAQVLMSLLVSQMMYHAWRILSRPVI